MNWGGIAFSLHSALKQVFEFEPLTYLNKIKHVFPQFSLPLPLQILFIYLFNKYFYSMLYVLGILLSTCSIMNKSMSSWSWYSSRWSIVKRQKKLMQYQEKVLWKIKWVRGLRMLAGYAILDRIGKEALSEDAIRLQTWIKWERSHAFL